MVAEAVGSIFKRKDGKYFLYLPKHLAEDTGFPFNTESSNRVRIVLDPTARKVTISELKRKKPP